MSEKKCAASQGGICMNAYAGGIRCEGYSKECRLRPVYLNLQNAVECARESLRRKFGIIGDKE